MTDEGTDIASDERAIGRDGQEIGGDPACWAHLVCPECGRFAEGDSAAKGVCAICGAALPSDED